MNFVSTRGRAPSVTAAEALVSGLAPDGGLYVPEYLPAPREDWEATANLTYAELAAEVLTLFFTDWEKEELLTLCRKAYNGTFNMPGLFACAKSVKDVTSRNCFMVGRWHLKTWRYPYFLIYCRPPRKNSGARKRR